MKSWLVVYYRGVPFVVGEIDTDSSVVSESGFFREGDFFLVTDCLASELPYPFWYTGDRTVYVKDYDQFLLEYGDKKNVVPHKISSIGTVVEK